MNPLGNESSRASGGSRPVTVHITGPGVAHVDSQELINSDEVRQLLARMDEVFAGENRRRPRGKQG